MQLLRNAVRPYAWGSQTAIAELQGRPHSAQPEAELWLGAHPADPSHLVASDGSEESLVDRVAADPEGELGPMCRQRWGDRLPFLLKFLAADQPLSLQAHPNPGAAAAGFLAEENAGIPRNHPTRNYRDPIAKPELLCALTEFHALAGFRDVPSTLQLLSALDVPSLRGEAKLLADQPDNEGVKGVFTTWIRLPAETVRAMLPELLTACADHVRVGGPFTVECETVLELGRAYPEDPGVLASLLLNRIVLQPGEAMFLPPGNLHAYLSGTGIEILANSDNILRCGLTPKHVDVDELLKVLDFHCGRMPVLRGDQRGTLTTFRTSVDEFELSRLEWSITENVDSVSVDSAGPQILLCTQGSVRLEVSDVPGGGAQQRVLQRGESVWLPASHPAVWVSPEFGVPGAGATPSHSAEHAGSVQLFRAAAGIA